MHILTLRKTATLAGAQWAAGRYLVDDINASQLLASEIDVDGEPLGSLIRLDSHLDERPFDPSEDGASILYIRAGGFGDLLFLTPLMAQMKRKWPKVKIGVACFPKYFSIMLGNPDVDEMVSYPLNVKDADRFSSWVSFENAIERGAGRELHSVQVFAQRAGVTVTDDRCRYFPSQDERDGAKKAFPRTDKPRLGVQVRASAMCRTYPPEKLQTVMADFLKNGWEVFAFGVPGEFRAEVEPPGFTNLSKFAFPFRESAAILETCDVVLAPDSSLAHLAGALGVPCVALYGSFPWKLRTANAPTTFAIQGVADCAPCHWHPRTRHFPPGKPCAELGHCVALDGITPERIIAAIKKQKDECHGRK